MNSNNATFQVELYYQRAFPPTTPKPEHWDMTVAEGGDLYLEDKQHEHPNLFEQDVAEEMDVAEGHAVLRVSSR